MNADYRALILEMADELDCFRQLYLDNKTAKDPTATRARALLDAAPATEAVGPDRLADEWSAANPFPEDLRRNPTVDELQAMAKMFGLEVNDWAALSWLVVTCIAGYGDAAHPAPVPVGERLPGVGDCNEDGEVWVVEAGYSYALGDTGDYDWEPHRIVLRAIGEFDARNGRTWLPHWALPLPMRNQQP